MPGPRTLLPASLLLAACTAGAPASGDVDPAAIASEITSAVAGLTEAMNAGDADALLAFYSSADDFAYLGCTEYILGGQSFARLVGPYYRPDLGEVFEQEIVQLQVLGPDAAVASLRGGSSSAENLFWTQVWRREGSRWVISLEHESWPGCDEPAAPHPLMLPPDTGAAGSG